MEGRGGALTNGPGPALSLPADWYHRPDVFARERAAIFGREWHLIGHAGALAAPGDYVADAIAGWRVFAIRGRDGALRAFHNVCRHRAAPLVEDGHGRCEVLRCRYHGWVYDTGGALRQLPDFGAADFDKADYGLFPVRVDTWRGLVFVNLDPAAPALREGLGALVAEAAGYPMEDFRFVRRVAYDIACNWKVYVDNYVEGYHIPLLHPELNRQVDASRYSVENRDRVCIMAAPLRDGSVYDGRWLWRYPNLSLAVYPDGMNLSRTLPLGHDRTRLVIDFFFRDPGPANERAIAMTCAVVEEDFPICEAVQRNLAAGVYEAGPLSPKHETGVRFFHDLVRRALAA